MLLLGGATLLLHVAWLGRYGVHRDELFVQACARHLDWGYVATGPLLPWLAALLPGDPEHLILMRLPSAMVGAMTIVAVGRLARALGGDVLAQMIAGLAAFTAPILLCAQHLMLPAGLELLVACLVFRVLTRLTRGLAGTGPWLLGGALCGAGVLAEPTFALMLAALLIAVAVSPARAQLRGLGVWWASAAALLVAAPELWWQSQHGWPLLSHLWMADAGRRATPWIEPVLDALLDAGALPLGLCVVGLVWLLSTARRALLPFGLLVPLLLVAQLLVGDNGHVLALALPILLASGACVLELWLVRRGGRVAAACALCVLVVVGAVNAPLALPILSAEQFPSWLRGSAPTGELDAISGWRELAQQVASAAEGLREGAAGSSFVLVDTYDRASAIALLGGEALAAVPVLSGDLDFWFWGRAELAGVPRPETGLLVGFDLQQAAAWCGGVELLGRLDRPSPVGSEDVPLLRCSEPIQWARLWPQLRRGF